MTLAVRGHQILEQYLNYLLVEALTDPDTFEVRRLSFALKADLVSAIYGFPERLILAKINAIRNVFVHDRTASFDKSESDALQKAWSDAFRRLYNECRPKLDYDTSTPIGILRFSIQAVGIELEQTLAHRRDEKDSQALLYEVLSEAAAGGLRGQRASEVIEQRLVDRRAARREQGKL